MGLVTWVPGSRAPGNRNSEGQSACVIERNPLCAQGKVGDVFGVREKEEAVSEKAGGGVGGLQTVKSQFGRVSLSLVLGIDNKYCGHGWKNKDPRQRPGAVQAGCSGACVTERGVGF